MTRKWVAGQGNPAKVPMGNGFGTNAPVTYYPLCFIKVALPCLSQSGCDP